MSAGYLFIQKPLVTALMVSGGMVALGALGKASLSKSNKSYLPEDSFGIKLIFDYLAIFIVWLGDTVMGKENRKFLPFLAVLFLYIFISNILGLIPGIALSTDQMQLNLGLALVVFGLYNIWSIKELGIKGYLHHLWGPIWWLGPFLLPIEVISHIIRPMTLSIRLFGNLTADHTVLSIFNEMTGGSIFFFLAIPFYFLGTLFSFVQAFVFTILSMIYIRLGTSHH